MVYLNLSIPVEPGQLMEPNIGALRLLQLKAHEQTGQTINVGVARG
jgi:hypothetical protein